MAVLLDVCKCVCLLQKQIWKDLIHELIVVIGNPGS